MDKEKNVTMTGVSGDKPQLTQNMSDTRVSGRVKVSLDEIIDNDLEGLLDILSERLTGNLCLMDIKFKAVSMNNTESGSTDIIFEVSGETDDDEDSE